MRLILGLVLAGVAASAAAGSAARAEGIEARDAWIRTPPPGAKAAAGYGLIVNRGIASDRLVGGRSSAAESVEVHQSSMAGGVVRMRSVPAGLAVGGSSNLRLRPEGYHLMLEGLRRPLARGQHVRITLRFQRAGDVGAEFTVRDTAP